MQPGNIGRHWGHERLARHRHAEPYVAVVLSGSYLEAGDQGRIVAAPGTVICHRAFEAHLDRFGASGATVLNLPAITGVEGAGRIADPDAIVRMAERDPRMACEAIRELFLPAPQPLSDWPDLLAEALNRNPDLAIAQWAGEMGLYPASVSRGFVRAYGVSPKRFRLEARTRRALGSLQQWRGSLAQLAADHGFADQAHLTRSVAALTGHSPASLKAKSVQD